jgi:hypothetical protein
MIRLKGLKEDEIKDNAHGIKKVLFGFQVSGGKMVTIKLFYGARIIGEANENCTAI